MRNDTMGELLRFLVIVVPKGPPGPPPRCEDRTRAKGGTERGSLCRAERAARARVLREPLLPRSGVPYVSVWHARRKNERHHGGELK